MNLRGFIDRLRGRPGLADLPPPESGWERGDLARCVISDDGKRWLTYPDRRPSCGPSRGKTLKVVGVYTDANSTWLNFAEFPAQSYPAGHFRKIRPDAAQACNKAFADKMKRLRPMVDA